MNAATAADTIPAPNVAHASRFRVFALSTTVAVRMALKCLRTLNCPAPVALLIDSCNALFDHAKLLHERLYSCDEQRKIKDDILHFNRFPSL